MKTNTIVTWYKTPPRMVKINVAIASESVTVDTKVPFLLLEVQAAASTGKRLKDHRPSTM